MLGTIFLELGRPDQAESFLYKAVKLTKYANAIPIVNLMSALKQNDDFELAIEVGQSALEAGRLETGMRRTVAEVLGNLHVGIANYTQASDWYFFAAMLEPNEASNEAVAPGIVVGVSTGTQERSGSQKCSPGSYAGQALGPTNSILLGSSY